MTLFATILIFLFLVIAAIIFAKNGKKLPMIACIAGAVVMFFLIAATFLLINGIDWHLLLASVLLLTACGSAEDEVITGNDWRVTGSYAWMTFEHGETINALVGMDADKLTVFLCSNHVIPILNKQH